MILYQNKMRGKDIVRALWKRGCVVVQWISLRTVSHKSRVQIHIKSLIYFWHNPATKAGRNNFFEMFERCNGSRAQAGVIMTEHQVCQYMKLESYIYKTFTITVIIIKYKSARRSPKSKGYIKLQIKWKWHWRFLQLQRLTQTNSYPLNNSLLSFDKVINVIFQTLKGHVVPSNREQEEPLLILNIVKVYGSLSAM